MGARRSTFKDFIITKINIFISPPAGDLGGENVNFAEHQFIIIFRLF
jgi:hypothetical protein